MSVCAICSAPIETNDVVICRICAEKGESYVYPDGRPIV